MNAYSDSEFGEIKITTSSSSRHVRLRLGVDGKLRASLPKRASIKTLQQLIDSSRVDIRKMLDKQLPKTTYVSGMSIGKSHTLLVLESSGKATSVKLETNQIILSLESGVDLNSEIALNSLKPAIIKALRKEAKAHLPHRLAYLAEKLGFSYTKVRFSHALSRWGSCSSNGTISLNIALMRLPFELIDYVLIHELSHTKELNHSLAFWELVKLGDPLYKTHRKQLKEYSPII